MGAPSIIQKPILVKPRFRFVSFDINGVTINASSTLAYTASLVEDFYRRAIVHLYSKPTIADVRRRRIPALLFATTDINDAASMVGADSGSDRYQQGYDYGSDGKLSAADFADTNGAVEIQSCRIDGSNLEIVFRNTLASNQTLNLFGAAYVFRDN